jgi:hypothetical protein
MINKVYLFFILLSINFALHGQTASAEKSITDRINDRNFPSIFQAWNRVENVPVDEITLAAKHDLLWQGYSYFGLKWNNNFPGLGTEFTPESIVLGLQKRKALLQKNPNMIILMELRHMDAAKNYLPSESPFWLRDNSGDYVYGWKEGGYIKLDHSNEDLKKIIIKQAFAAVNSGIFDGVMLDWWTLAVDNDPDKLDLLKRIRESIGPEELIIVNANDHTIPNSARYVNGIFMECYKSNKDDRNWADIETTLLWAETNLQEPHINCLETWFEKSRNDLNRMRATTTLALTHSNGYALFSDPNELPTPDHLHNWYSFWDVHLGKAVEKGFKRKDGMWQREFSNGTAIYNPVSNFKRTITFNEDRVRVSDGTTGNNFIINYLDGDIFLYK